MILHDLKKSKNYLVPAIFGKKEFETILNIIQDKKLTSTQRSYLSRSIRNKIYASKLINELGLDDKIIYKKNPISKDFYLNGLASSSLSKNILQKRIDESKILIQKYSKQNPSFIVGSFLTKTKYNDIDLIIVSNEDKEERIGNLHLIYIPKKGLKNNLFFHSAIKISISNSLLTQKINSKKDFRDFWSIFQEVFNLYNQKDNFKQEARDLFILGTYLKTNHLLDSSELNEIFSTNMSKIKKFSISILRSLRKRKNFSDFFAKQLKIQTQLKQYDFSFFKEVIEEVLKDDNKITQKKIKSK